MRELWILVPVIAVGAYFGWRYFRHGGLVGALLGGKTTKVLGEVDSGPTGLLTHVLRVERMERPGTGEQFIALIATSKSGLSLNVAPFKLSPSQARELSKLLDLAAGG